MRAMREEEGAEGKGRCSPMAGCELTSDYWCVYRVPGTMNLMAALPLPQHPPHSLKHPHTRIIKPRPSIHTAWAAGGNAGEGEGCTHIWGGVDGGRGSGVWG